MKTILVVEDDNRINEIVADYLETAGYQVVCAKNGIEGLELFESNDIDLVVLDIMMPGLDGWSLCRRIRKNSNVLIIILSARSDEDDKLMGFELGADEYVTKPFSPKVLVARITALLSRYDIPETSSTAAADSSVFVDEKSMAVYVDDNQVQLTAKEFHILSLLSKDPGRVFSREILLQKIWGFNYFGDGRVIDTNIKTLRKKISPYSSCITTIIGIGYKYVIPEVKK